MCVQQGHLVKNEKYTEANPLIGATDTGGEMLWKVILVHFCIELGGIGDKT